MPDAMTGTVEAAAAPESPRVPETIYNCPSCSHYLPPGTMACPECQAIIYSGHLRTLAVQAANAEKEQRFDEARALWRQTLDWLPPGTRQAEAVNAKILALDARTRAQEDFKAKWTKRLGPFAPFFFFLAKLKSFFFLLFKFKTILSFLAYAGLYSAMFNWKFGCGFALSVLTHEMGHYAAAKRRGLKVDLPVFLPGFGAYVRWYSSGVTLETLAGIALAGPFFGLLFTFVCAGLTLRFNDPNLAALAHISALLNALNLIPFWILDGSQATLALNKMQRGLVLATSLILFGLLNDWLFLVLALCMGWKLWRDPAPEQPSSRAMVYYVLLLFSLGLLMYRFPAPARPY
jgi:Zn-dependent protease